MSQEGEPTYEDALANLRDNPNFKVLLKRLKIAFAGELSKLADCSASEAEKHRGVVKFAMLQYREISGESICGDDSIT